MNMTRAQLAALLKANPQISLADETSLDALLPDPLGQRHPLPPLEYRQSGQAGSLERPSVRFTSRRCRLLDPDNLAGGCKALLDGLVRSGLLPGDGPDDIAVSYHQQKVERRHQEATIVEIIYPEPI